MLTFEFAKPTDLKAIVATYNSTVAGRMVTADLEPVSVESKLPWFQAHNQTTRPLWIIKEGDNYLGWLSFNSFYGRPAYNGCVEISIYLEESARGKGVGKACLVKAIAYAKEINVHTLLGFIFGHNDVSLKLFENYGFKVWANFPEIANMDGVMRDLLILGLKVNPTNK